MQHAARTSALPRRTLLRGAGVALGLPLLDAMVPARRRLFGGEPVPTAPDEPSAGPRRLLAVCNNLGFVPDRFFPEGEGKDYQPSEYLAELDGLRDRYTALSGVSHPGVDGSHASDVSFLTAAPHPGGGGFRNTVSLDQYVAARVGPVTRFPSLTLGVNAMPGRRSLSFTESGVLIPPEDSAAAVYRRLFLKGTPSEVAARRRDLALGRSIMDAVNQQAVSLAHRLGAADRSRLDQYQTAVRDTERRLAENEGWMDRPKPEPPGPAPVDPGDKTQFMEKAALMFRMARLAFETDSTRAVTLLLDTNFTPSVDLKRAGVEITDGYHNLSHHGRNARKLAQLEAIDKAHMRTLAGFLAAAADTPDGDADLLTNTAVIYGSNLGDANKHTTTNLPALIAGGRFAHAGHLAFDRTHNEPLANLYVSVLRQMGFDVPRFASGARPLPGLEIAA